MKIAYLTFIEQFRGTNLSGVTKKTLAQMDGLRARGNDVRVIVMDQYAPSSPDEQNHVRLIGPAGGRWSWPAEIPLRVYHHLKTVNPDVIYFRYSGGMPFLGSALLRLSPPVVTELNGVFPRTLRIRNAYHKWVAERLFGRSVLAAADGAVGVTKEILNIEKKRLSERCTSYLSLSNGCILPDRPIAYEPFEDGYLHAAFLGRGKRKGGFDRILRMYEEHPDLNLKIHWCSDVEPEIRRSLPDQVHMEGYKDGPELTELLRRCDIGIGNLGFFRAGFSFGCPLKVRDYLAHGLPVIIGYDDPDLEEKDGFVLRIPAREAPPSPGALLQFARSMRENPEMRNQARSRAERISYRNKMKSLHQFLLHVVRKTGKLDSSGSQTFN